MTPDQFKAWRKSLGLSQQGAAAALGLSKGSVDLYERGSRRDDGRPVEIPVTVELACAAVVAMVQNGGADPSDPQSLRRGAESLIAHLRQPG